MQVNLSVLKTHKTPLLITFISCVLYVAFAYDLERTQYLKLISLYSALFGMFYWLIKTHKNNIPFLAVIAFLFRALFILAIPNLSQDFYRFIWDGRIILAGFNPYLHTVESFITNGDFPVSQALELYNSMGTLNASHYTNYPPINQLCFIIASLFAVKSILGSVVVLRLIIIAADFGTFYFGKKLLEKLKLPVYNIFWYVLNPFIIIELTGNLHFEGVMIFFLVWSLYLLEKGKWSWSAVIFALSVSTKLIPLVFLPLFFQWFVKRNVIANTVKQSVSKGEIASSQVPRNDEKLWIPAFTGMTRLISFYAIIGGVTLLLFAPFFSKQFIINYTETVALWFQNFEFNASFYYIAREIGFTFRGYNEIAIIGKYIPYIVVLFVLIISFFRRNDSTKKTISAMLLVLSFYYFTATTVHPWYIATLLALSIFTKHKFPLVWSFVIVLSYLAYMQTGNAHKSENLWIIGLEYLIVYSVFFWEIFNKKSIKV